MGATGRTNDMGAEINKIRADEISPLRTQITEIKVR